jgi:hypothetical protein
MVFMTWLVQHFGNSFRVTMVRNITVANVFYQLEMRHYDNNRIIQYLLF